MTPSGRKLPGIRQDGFWSCSFEYQNDRNIADRLDHILERLIIGKDLFDRLGAMGAQSALYLQLPGDVNNGDRIPWEVLQKFVALKIAFELEIFPEWI